MRKLIERQKIRKQDREAFKKELVKLKRESQQAYIDFRALWADKDKYVGLSDIVNWQEKYKGIHDRISVALSNEDFKFFRRLYKDDIEIVPRMYKHIEKYRRKHNKPVLNRLRNVNADRNFRIGDVTLNKEQRTAVIMDEQRLLTIGTGSSGLTLTCIAKAKYLVNEMNVPAEKILFLSDSDDGAEHVNKIMEKEISGLKAQTFVDFSSKLIQAYGKKVPALKDINYEKFTEEAIVKLLEEDFYKKRFIDYYVNFKQAGFVVFDFNNNDEYERYLEEFPPITLEGKKVRNYEHLAVADFLYRNNIRYRYMKDYVVSTNEFDGTIYKPVFYLPDFDIYIEVFEINSVGEARFEKKTTLLQDTPTEMYREKMNRIREIHRKNNTVMVEVFTYEKMDGTLAEHLQQKLLKHDVVFAKMDTEDLLKAIYNQNPVIIRELSIILSEVLALARDYVHTWDEIVSLNRGIALTKARGYRRNESLIALLVPVYEEYMKLLGDDIDSFGMLNLASETVRLTRKDPGYTHIIVDNFENMNRQSYNLLKNIWDLIKDNGESVIYCAGNDWQCKSGMNANNMSYLADFSRLFGRSETVTFTNSYNQCQAIWSTNARFIEKNKEQIRKYARCHLQGRDSGYFTPLQYQYFRQDKSSALFDEAEIEMMRNTVKNYINLLPREYSVLLVGRFMEDIELAAKLDLENIPVKTVYELNQSADVVIIINARRYNLGFPDWMMIERVKDLFGIKPEYYLFAAERRLWHQAISRAKYKVAFLYNSENKSRFIEEFL